MILGARRGDPRHEMIVPKITLIPDTLISSRRKVVHAKNGISGEEALRLYKAIKCRKLQRFIINKKTIYSVQGAIIAPAENAQEYSRHAKDIGLRYRT